MAIIITNEHRQAFSMVGLPLPDAPKVPHIRAELDQLVCQLIGTYDKMLLMVSFIEIGQCKTF